jgi:ribosomal protein L22
MDNKILKAKIGIIFIQGKKISKNLFILTFVAEQQKSVPIL